VGAFPLDRKFGLDQGFDVNDDEFGHRSSQRIEELERRAEDVVAKALPWVKSQSSQWFLWVHVYDPHDPYSPPAPYAEQYSQSPYDGEVAYVDSVLGRFLKELKENQLLEDTLVIFTSDHGESLGQHGEQLMDFSLITQRFGSRICRCLHRSRDCLSKIRRTEGRILLS
jgi:membrane-anchored protein YejM (alkaline phosphatase superfamily)